MAEEISKPLAEAQKVTMVSSGGSEIGAAKLTGEVLDIMTRLPDTVEKLTGVSISQVSHTHIVCNILRTHSEIQSQTYDIPICMPSCTYDTLCYKNLLSI